MKKTMKKIISLLFAAALFQSSAMSVFAENESVRNDDDKVVLTNVQDGPAYRTGDINADGKIDVTDLSNLSLYLIGDMKLTDAQKKAADVDKDGEVKLSDLAKYRQYLSQVIDSLETVIWKMTVQQESAMAWYYNDKVISSSLREALENEQYKDCRFAVTPEFEYKKGVTEETVKMLETSKIKYKIDEVTNQLILFLTIPEFNEISIEGVNSYTLALSDKAE